MKRREFIAWLGAAAWPLPLRAQQVERARRVGVLIGFGENDPEGKVRLSAITQALAKLDWVDGHNVQIHVR
jgi:putative tryptophan/tyrosine transport system substrate-binding protein